MRKRLSNIDLKEIYRAWHSTAGLFRCFVRASNFVSLKHYPDFEIPEVTGDRPPCFARICTEISKIQLHETMLAIDLPDALTLKAANMLYEDWRIMPILTFKGLLHPYGLVGSQTYIGLLLGYGEQLTEKKESKGHVFIMDSNRFGDYEEDDLKRSFNNQYELNEEDLPSVEMLQELGYSCFLYMHDGKIKEDLEAYLHYLQEAGFPAYAADVGGSE